MRDMGVLRFNRLNSTNDSIVKATGIPEFYAIRREYTRVYYIILVWYSIVFICISNHYIYINICIEQHPPCCPDEEFLKQIYSFHNENEYKSP